MIGGTEWENDPPYPDSIATNAAALMLGFINESDHNLDEKGRLVIPFSTDPRDDALVVHQGACRIYRVGEAAYLGICAREEAAPAPGVIITLVSPEVEAWHLRLQAAGVEVVQPPSHSERYRIFHAFYRDPDGHLLEVQQFDDPRWVAG